MGSYNNKNKIIILSMYKSFTILAVTAAYAAANTCTWDWPADPPGPVDDTTPASDPVNNNWIPFDITAQLC